MKKIITCSIILSLVLSLSACDNQSMDNTVFPSNTGNNTEEINHTKTPDNFEESNKAGVSEIENDTESEQPSIPPLKIENTISLEDETNAKNEAITYYKDTAFAGRVTELVRITDNTKFESYVSDEIKIDTVIAFEVTISDSATPPRIILLSKETSGDWIVINEGH